ncbi:MAG: SLBB domain-containing protein [Treponema sp.]|nr:SLBB domain-containing protein [Treponema sp.]
MVLFVMLLFYTASLSAQEKQIQGSQIQTENTTQNARSIWNTQNAQNTQNTQNAQNTQNVQNAQNTQLAQNAQLARSNPDYLVTAGDVYTLAYSANGAAITYGITVDSSYRIRISNLGILNAEGKTFRQLKIDAETIVSNNYPLSGVQLVLNQPGVFRVFVNGEVHIATEISTWALARLSSLTEQMTAYASLRNITVKSGNGKVRTYDLFKAERLGDLSQNPYLRPDDVITFNRFDRQVTINGSVERPGVYQLFDDEHLKDLIETYANGFTPFADKTRIELIRYIESGSISGDRLLLKKTDVDENYILRNYDIVTIPDINETRPVATVDRLERRITLEGAVRRPGTYDLLPHENLRELIEVYGDGFIPLADATRMELIRYVNSDSLAGEKIRMDETALDDNYSLENYDTVYIPSIVQLRPVFFIEGAIKNTDADTAEPSVSFQQVVTFNSGETYSSVVRRNAGWFTAESDTLNAYIERGTDRIQINLNRILYDASFRSEILIEEYDRLIIPFRQYFITVAGAVGTPGRYPYIPDREWDYYISLAGGFLPGRNFADSVRIQDINGKTIKKTDIIGPETTITAQTNHWLYYFSQIAPIVTTVLSIVTTVISVSLIAR